VVRLALVAVLVGCGSASPPPPAPPPAAIAPPPPVVDEKAKHDEIVAAHRAIEEEQQSALAATCDEPKGHEAHERCLPSCYPTEPADIRAGKKLLGVVEIAHLACEPAGGTGTGPFAIVDEIGGAKLGARPVRGGAPRGHRKGTWQATVEAALVEAQRPKLVRGETIVVSGVWRELAHPLTKVRLRCVTFSHYTRLHRALDGCGGDGGLACEATGNAAARGINVVHYRLDEARALQAAGKTTECQQAALEAVAVARGLPRWRQYMKLNVAKWTEHPGYRTRFDGVLDEDALFAEATRQGGEAQEVYAACGGPAAAPTTVAQEQSFHACW
jgi:hypothetical protein